MCTRLVRLAAIKLVSRSQKSEHQNYLLNKKNSSYLGLAFLALFILFSLIFYSRNDVNSLKHITNTNFKLKAPLNTFISLFFKEKHLISFSGFWIFVTSSLKLVENKVEIRLRNLLGACLC